jgi:predicted branched-subunit amino acid permease
MGFQLGSLITTPEVWGLDFALPAMFIGLMLPLCTRRPAIVAAICGGAASVLFHCLGFGTGAVVTGALVGATAGVVCGGDERVE